jgi:Stress up-regulated Nod 19
MTNHQLILHVIFHSVCSIESKIKMYCLFFLSQHITIDFTLLRTIVLFFCFIIEVVFRYYGLKVPSHGDEHDQSKIILVRNSGLCKHTLGQYYGLGSETRKTDTWVPDPYGIVVGIPEEVPAGYEERWLLNVHAIDTRGVTDRLGCTECR